MPDETPAAEPNEDDESRSRKEHDPADDVEAHRKEHEPADDVQAHRHEHKPAERHEH
ncbi:MAG TPA: hypothetical protein VFD90_21615 [Gaiellales bacterium]|jgi:hypothetical protein|nr:hypothetical protein [Gaiellales bacterium]